MYGFWSDSYEMKMPQEERVNKKGNLKDFKKLALKLKNQKQYDLHVAKITDE